MDLTENKNQVDINTHKNANNKKSRSQHFKGKKKQPNFALEVFVTTLKMFILLIFILGFAAFGAVLGIGKAYLDSTPELDIAKIEDQSETSFIYDKDGNLITEYFGFENRIWAPIEEIPKILQDAFIAVEDMRFYSHRGIDYRRMVGAFINNLKNDSVQGASTITQQLIKNSILSPERTYKRKIQEMYLAIQLEKKYSKQQILEAYLNTIHLGGSNYGVKVAAKDYFGKELDELTLRECAILAGATQNPSKYDPRRNLLPVSSGGRGTPEWTYKRTNIVLKAMYENGYISQEEYENAKFQEDNPDANQVHIIEKSQAKQMYPMPYFIEYVIYDVRDKIMQQKGWKGDEGRRKAEQLIYAGGLKIYTTVDPDIQTTMENVIYNYDNLPKFANPQKHSVSSQGIPQPQVAAVIMDQHTGEIRGVVGGKQPPTQQRQLNRAFMSKLPLGSSMKPLAAYGPFIEAGYPGGIIFENIPAPIEGWQSERGYPQNYAGGGYTGPVDVRTGIRRSLNVVSARIVADPNRVGPHYSANKLIELGIDEEDISGYTNGSPSPAALALGTHGNNMVEVTAAYAAIANRGIYQEPISFTKVLDKNDNEILNTSNQITRVVFKESTAFILTDWMQDAISNGTGSRAKFNDPMPIAGKTGTNADFRGVYFAGFTPYYTGAVWIGHDDFQPSFTNGSTGGVFAAPLWRAFMEPIHEGLENKPFYENVPDDVVKVTVCGVSGLLPNGNLCAHDSGGHGLVTEYFPKDAVPTEVCNIHRQVALCNASGKYPTPYCPESEISTKSVVALPEGSPYRSLSNDLLQKYLPGALKDFLGPDELDYNNPEHAGYFCPIHTKEWKDSENEKGVLHHQAQDLINKIKMLLENPGIKKKMTPEEIEQLENGIAQLEKLLKQSTQPSNEDGGPVVDSEQIRHAMDDLNRTANSILNRIKDSQPIVDPKPGDDITDTPPDNDDDDNNGNNNNDHSDGNNNNNVNINNYTE